MEPFTINPFQDILDQALGYTWIVAIIAGPFVFAWLFFVSYVTYKRNKFIFGQTPVLLEVKLSKMLPKSPLAMELFLTSLYQTKGESTWISRYIHGKVRPWFSLEIASFGGEIHFYIRCWKFWKSFVTSSLYAQFPDVEVTETEDYTSETHFDESKIDLWGSNYVLTKPDHYPILSYTHYGLEKDPDEELKIDPMTPLLEYLGSLKDGEQVWLQILIRAHKSEKKHPDKMFKKVDWTHAANEEIKKLKEKGKTDLGGISIEGSALSRGDKEIIDAIQKNISKTAFDTIIRGIYLAPLDRFNDFNTAGLNGSFKQYNSGHLNKFDNSHETEFKWPWQNITGKRLLHAKHHMLEAYQLRAGFHTPNKAHLFVMNTESLATIYHFPGEAAKTPSIRRIEAKKAEAPQNLPI